MTVNDKGYIVSYISNELMKHIISLEVSKSNEIELRQVKRPSATGGDTIVRSKLG